MLKKKVLLALLKLRSQFREFLGGGDDAEEEEKKGGALWDKKDLKVNNWFSTTNYF